MRAALLFLAVGWALGRRLGLRAALHPVARWAAAFLLGIAGLGTALYLASHLGGLPIGRVSILLVGLGLCLLGLGRTGESGTEPTTASRPHAGRLAWGVGAVAACLWAGLLVDAVISPTYDFDGRMTWVTAARYVRSEGSVDATAFREPRWFLTHPQYPLLMPLAQVVALELENDPSDGFSYRLLYTLFYPALLALVYAGSRSVASQPAALLCVLSVAVMPVLTSGEGSAGSAYSDLPLACFLGAAVLVLQTARSVRHGLLAGIFLAAAVLTKAEGIPLAVLCLIACAVSAGRSKSGWRAVATAASALLLAILFLEHWKSGIPNRFDEDYLHFLQSGVRWGELVPHAWAALRIAAAKMTNLDEWGIYAYLWVGATALGWRAVVRRTSPGWLMLVAAPAALGLAAAAVHWNTETLAATTWNRFLIQGLVGASVLFACGLEDLVGRWLRASAGSVTDKGMT